MRFNVHLKHSSHQTFIRETPISKTLTWLLTVDLLTVDLLTVIGTFLGYTPLQFIEL